MFRFRVFLPGIGLLALLAASGCEDGTAAGEAPARVGKQPPVAKPSIPEERPLQQPKGITLSPHKMNFAAVGHRVDKEREFELHNNTNRPIKVTRVAQSCDCIKPRFPLGEIPPGERRKGVIKVEFGTGFGAVNKYVRFHIEGKENTATLFVNWNFHPALKRPKERVFQVQGVFGKQLPMNRAELSISRKIPGDQPLRVENVRFKGTKTSTGHVEVEAHHITKDQVRFVATLSAQHPEGRVSGRLLADVEGLPLALSLRGKVYRGLRTHPDNFQFSKIEDPGTAQTSVKITSTDDRPFEIQSVRADPEIVAVTVEPLPGADGTGYELTARLTGPFEDRKRNRSVRAKVYVETTHPDKPDLTLRVHGVILRIFPK